MSNHCQACDVEFDEQDLVTLRLQKRKEMELCRSCNQLSLAAYSDLVVTYDFDEYKFRNQAQRRKLSETQAERVRTLRTGRTGDNTPSPLPKRTGKRQAVHNEES